MIKKDCFTVHLNNHFIRSFVYSVNAGTHTVYNAYILCTPRKFIVRDQTLVVPMSDVIRLPNQPQTVCHMLRGSCSFSVTSQYCTMLSRLCCVHQVMKDIGIAISWTSSFRPVLIVSEPVFPLVKANNVLYTKVIRHSRAY